MRFSEVIARKRDGCALTQDAISTFVQGVSDGSLPDYQTAALLMAIMLRGMTDEETAWLTEAMRQSGECVDLTSIPGVKVGKHSTGGVGDKVSIVLGPVVAACGVIVPKMSGRGLGHTGGTLDKLESIPGYRTNLEVPEFVSVLRDVGVSIIGQSARLVPADKKLYALRDVTATVESVPLIAASIMSKKLAEGSTALVLDVKCGHGGLVKTEADARALARAMVTIGGAAGIPTHALMSRMDAPLGRAVGNALEIAECIEILRGRGPEDLTGAILTLGTRMVMLGTGASMERAQGAVQQAVSSGAALARFRAMVERQGGDATVIDHPERLPVARHSTGVTASRSGYITGLHAEHLGRAAVGLGAGRERVGDPIDHAAGIIIETTIGSPVRAGDVVLHLRYNDSRRLDDALRRARSAIDIGDAPTASLPLEIGWVA
jgi:pyrimidine-nucleoside phosphorylase